MAITAAVLALETDATFRAYAKLNFVSAADSILGGNFPNNVTTDTDKNKVSAYAAQVFRGEANVNAQVLALLAQSAMQTLINATPPGDYYGAMSQQAKVNFRNLAGVLTVYGETAPPL